MNSPAACRPSIPSKSGRASPATWPLSASKRAPSSVEATCCFRSIRGRSRPRSIASAQSSRARAATVQRADSELKRAERLSAENAIAGEERDRRASFAQESSAQTAAVEAALRAAELNLEFTQVTSPIDGRVGRAIVTEGNLVSGGTGEATLLTTVVSLDPVYAYFDADEQIFLKYTGATGPRSRRRPTELPIRMALANEEGFPREGRLDFLDNQLDGATGTIRGRAVFRNTDGLLTPGLFVRLRVAGTGSHPGLLIQDRAVGTDLNKKFVYVVGPEARDRIPDGDARPDRRWLARRPLRIGRWRTGRDQRPAAGAGLARR